MQKYQSMKNSGVAWLGDIPSDWEQKQARYIFKQAKDSVGQDPSKYELLSLTLRGVIPRSQVDGGKNPENYNTYQIVRENDLIMCLFDYDVTPRTVGRATTTGMVTGAYTNLRPQKGISTRYYNYFFLALDTTKELLHLCTGLRNGISKPTFFSLNLPVPDYATQTRIADYLDREIEKIDVMIVKQERLLKLIEEKRRVTITNAVTRGIRENVQFEKPEDEWFPELPAHWSTSKLKYFTELITDGTHTTPNYIAEGVPFLSIKDISSGKIDFSDTKFISEEEHLVLSKHAKIEKGDILFTRIGTLGVNVVVDTDKTFDIFVSLGLLKLTPGAINTKYLVYCMSSNYYLEYIQQVKAGGGTAAAKFNLGDVAKSPIIVPPRNEQDEIVLFLNNYLIKHEKMVEQALLQIKLLKERRASLISNVVTGKAKV